MFRINNDYLFYLLPHFFHILLFNILKKIRKERGGGEREREKEN